MIIPELNFIMNGCMRINQRGSVSSATSDSWQIFRTMDRWAIGQIGAVRVTVSQDTDVPANTNLTNSAKILVTAKDDSIATTDHCQIFQSIEGYDFQHLSGKYCLLSFWIKSEVTGTMGVSFRNNSLDRSFVSDIVINSASTWELKTVPIIFNEPTGTWNKTDWAGVHITFTLSIGATYQTTADIWQTGNYGGTSSQTNFTATANKAVWLTGIQLHRSSRYIPFRMRKYQEELELCLRYYYQGIPNWFGVSQSATEANRIGGSHPVPMIAAPTVGYEGTVYVTPGSATNYNLSAVAYQYSNTLFAESDFIVATGLTVGGSIVTQGTGVFTVGIAGW